MKHQWFLEGNFADNSNDNSTFVDHIVLSKCSKVGLRNVYWRLSSIFDLGLCILIGQSKLSNLPAAPGLLIDIPGYEVDTGSTLSNNQQINQ